MITDVLVPSFAKILLCKYISTEVDLVMSGERPAECDRKKTEKRRLKHELNGNAKRTDRPKGKRESELKTKHYRSSTTLQQLSFLYFKRVHVIRILNNGH